jgi:OOP family OmpA-OmpF porin
VYVDGELEGALMPNGYTRFCVKPGTHSIEAYIADAPLYAGKSNPKTEVNLQGGSTYFVAVNEKGTGEPVPFRRADAERLLTTSVEQTNIINRASRVVPCSYRVVVAEAPIQFKVNASVLFDFDRGDMPSVKPEGRKELKKIAEQMLALPAGTVAGVSIVGHSDPMGNAAYNLQLSERRAQTVGDVLAEYGIARSTIRTSGMGSANPVVDCPRTGSRESVLACNAANRRVEIKVEQSAPANNASK